jgi:ribosome-associated protein
MPTAASANSQPPGGPLETLTTLESYPVITHLPSAEERALLCARVGDENKAKNIVVLDMRGVSPLFDYFVLMTGISRRQIHTLAEECDAAMNAVGDRRTAIQGYQASRWIVQDYGDVVVHVFDEDSRTYYSLEDLWADAPKVDWTR